MQFLNTLRVPVFIGVAASIIDYIYSVLIPYKLRLLVSLLCLLIVFVYRWEFWR